MKEATKQPFEGNAMTESEARNLWCPFARVGLTRKGQSEIANGPAINRTATGLIEGSACIGSACMAWRWDAYSKGRPRLKDDHGWCGFAGEP